ncbi:MAG: sulfatase-like hydrolase/transferase, partial [Planctomycetes bacterium]|nr:sulfatase-like hydrolase/transferase [Planctomycetota bacterium]
MILVILSGLSAPVPASVDRPNIVLLLADDLGWGDVGYHGGAIRTPNLDRLATEGIRLENFHVCPLCSPTRAGLMTGRWPIRYGMMKSVITPLRQYGLPTSEQTLAELLARAGYRRRGVFGKWPLGHYRKELLPLARGFTHFVGCYNGAFDYFSHKREGQLDWHRDHEPCRDQGYVTDLIGREAARLSRAVRRRAPSSSMSPLPHPMSRYKPKRPISPSTATSPMRRR